ncbi:MAG: peptidylprolyl isomerase [Microscillaceae bacterium]|nr:peptidylprolyl isomerase [Microscillaceae bacterium]
MAIITRIRKYSGVAIFFIGFSIVAFVLADLLGQNFFSSEKRYVGEINGQNIDYNEYNAKVERALNNYRQQSGESPSEAQISGIRDQVWNTFLFDYAYQEQFEQLGITVTEEELYQMVQGDSAFIHPEVRRQFTDPQTQKFDKNRIVEFLKQLPKLPVEQQAQWADFEEYLKKDRLQRKYEALFRISDYVTKAEAQRLYEHKTAKAKVKYVFVPFTSLIDSVYTAKITDAQLKEELNKYPEKYKAREQRSLDYVVFDILPSSRDSVAFSEEIRQLAKDFAKAPNDSAFAATNSDAPGQAAGYQTLAEIPTVLFDKNPALLKGGIYGPHIDGKSYKIFKVTDIREDSVDFVRARHILFQIQPNATAEEKEKARTQANEVLQKIKEGSDFAKMAQQYGQDGTKDRGGDLGWFKRGQMVGPFEAAAFAPENPGLLPNLVETNLGFHILEVTQTKNRNTYKLATIERGLEPSEETRDSVLYLAEEFRAQSENGDQFRENIKKNPKLVLLNAPKLATSASSLGGVQGLREVVRWAFNDASVGDVSEVFEAQEQNKYVIATLTEKIVKDESTVEAFREQLMQEVLKKVKAEAILKKLDLKAKSLEEMAKKYGAEAQINTLDNVTLENNVLGGTGFNPRSVGTVFGLSKGKRSGAIQDEAGLMVIELIALSPAPKIADFGQYKTEIQQKLAQRTQFLISEAIKEASNIEDNRYKFY